MGLSTKQVAHGVSHRFRFSGYYLVVLGTVLGVAFCFSNGFAYQEGEEPAPQESRFVSNELLIKIKKPVRGQAREGNPLDTGISSLNEIHRELRATGFERVAKLGKGSDSAAELFGWYKVTLEGKGELIAGKLDEARDRLVFSDRTRADRPDRASLVNPASLVLGRLIARCLEDSNVEAVDLNYEVVALAVPNDPYYSSSGSWGQSYPDLWGIKKINSAAAWDQTTGSSSIIVADIDTGVDRNHPDLAGNIWVNTREIPGNGIDDDRNGYVDDYYGWDWANRDSDPMDDHGHGTHTVGTIAAVGNNGTGVVGVNWNVRIMALKFLSSGGFGSLSDGIKALQYAADMGAKVSSNSWGCNCSSAAMDDAVQYEHDRGMVMVAAAGNSNSDAIDFSPADADYAITAAASDPNDVRASFSNWGEKIDGAAPGVDVLSLRAAGTDIYRDGNHFVPVGDPNARYYRASGTSMAAPHVSGLAALLWSRNPSLSNEEVRQIIRTGADDLGVPGKDRDFGYGRMNAARSMSKAGSNLLAPLITSPRSRTLAVGNAQVFGGIPGPNFANYKVELGTGRAPASWTTLATSTTQVTNGVLASFDANSLAENSLNIIRLTATDTAGSTFQFQVHDVTVDNIDAILTAPRSSIYGIPVDVMGTAQTKNGVSFGSFILEYKPTSAVVWSTAGITLVNGGTQPILNGKLGTWDTSPLTNNVTYNLRLTVRSADGRQDQTLVSVIMDKDVLPGWPKDLGIGLIYDVPSVADLDNDGQEEIVLAPMQQKLIYAFKKDGSNMPGWPVMLSGTIGGNAVPIDDVNGDGKREVVVVTGGPGPRVEVFGWDGKPLPGWPQAVPNAVGLVSIGDLDGDGKKDIVAISHDWAFSVIGDPLKLSLYAFRGDGTLLTGFPKRIVDTVSSVNSASSSQYYLNLVDLEGDGRTEMILSPQMENSEKVYVLDNQGNLKPGWPRALPGYGVYRTLAGDITGDGRGEVIVYYSVPKTSGADTYLTVFDASGNQLPGWPQWAARAVSNMGPALADATGDRILDILVPMYGIGGGDTLFDNSPLVFTKDGLVPNPPGYKGHEGLPAIVDFDGDGQPNVIAASRGYGSIHALRKFTDTAGQLGWEVIWEKKPGPIAVQPIVSDMDKNGRWEVIAPVNTPTGTLIYAWEAPSSDSRNGAAWGQYVRDAAKSGTYPVSVSSPPDGTPPTVSITSPASGSTLGGTVLVTATATDNVGVAKVEFYVDNLLKATDTISPYSFSWDTTLVMNGSHSLVAKGYDAAGNVGISSMVTVTVSNGPPPDATPPTVSITSPANGSLIPRNGFVSIAVLASDNVGVSKVEIWIDGILNATLTAVPYTTTWIAKKVANGAHTIRATAYDAVGNNASATITVYK